MSPARYLVGLCGLVLVVAAIGAAQPMRVPLTIDAPPELAAVARRVEVLRQDDLTLLFALTGATVPVAPIRVVLTRADSPPVRNLPPWVSGFTVPHQRLIVLLPERVRTYPDRNLQVLLHHEVAHVLVAQAAGHRPVPRWFNEGIATVAAREWGLEDRARYAMAVVGKGPRTTAELDAGFAGDSSQAVRSYALSAAFVRFLRERHGPGMTAAVLAQLADGTGFDAAFRRVTGEPLAAAEEAFFEDEAFWSTWVPFLTSTTALWMAITSLALLAIRRRRERSRQMHEAWEREERIHTLHLDHRRQQPVTTEDGDGSVN